MTHPMRTGVKVILAINVAGLLGFAWLGFVQPVFTDLNVRMRYTQLDREGVINVAASQKFHPSYGFATGNHRSTVPHYIAERALDAERANALWAMALSVTNAILCVALLVGRPQRQ